MSDTETKVETTLKAILVMEEDGSEHNDADGMERRWVKVAFRAVYVPDLDVLATERVVTVSDRRGGARTATAEIVVDYPTAVRRAVVLADEARAAAKAAAKEQP